MPALHSLNRDHQHFVIDLKLCTPIWETQASPTRGCCAEHINTHERQTWPKHTSTPVAQPLSQSVTCWSSPAANHPAHNARSIIQPNNEITHNTRASRTPSTDYTRRTNRVWTEPKVCISLNKSPCAVEEKHAWYSVCVCKNSWVWSCGRDKPRRVAQLVNGR